MDILTYFVTKDPEEWGDSDLQPLSMVGILAQVIWCVRIHSVCPSAPPPSGCHIDWCINAKIMKKAKVQLDLETDIQGSHTGWEFGK